MNQTARLTFQDELLKLHGLVLNLANEVKMNGELLLEYLQKHEVPELFTKIKNKDKEIDKIRWQVHDFGDELIILQQPVAKDFRQIITSIQITDNLERIGDHFKKTARYLEKFTLSEIEVPQEIIKMVTLGLNMLSQSISAYSQILEGKTNEISKEEQQKEKHELVKLSTTAYTCPSNIKEIF